MLKLSRLSWPSLEAATIVFASAVTLVFGLSLLLISKEMNRAYVSYHQSISTDATSNVGDEVHRFLLHKKHMVATFLTDNLELVTRIASRPDDKQLYQTLNIKLSRYFTDFFATTIATQEGQLLLRSHDNKINDTCLADLRDYINSGNHLIRAHPDPIANHFDILVDFRLGTKKLIFFVSFNTNEISSLLKTSAPDKHKLMIIGTTENTIEIKPLESHDHIQNRLGSHLTKNENNRTLSSFHINGTSWNVIDIHNKNLFTDYKQQLLKQGSIIYTFFIFITVLMCLALYVGIQRKNRLHEFLVQKNKEILALNKKLEKLSLTDGLTRLHNRRYLDIKSTSEFNTARRLNIPLSIAVIDIDYFKQYNDLYGHQAGDECIINITKQILKNFRRSNESAVRYGGEEFIIMNLGDETSTFVERLKKLLHAIEAMQIEHKGSEISNYVTISIGIAALPDDKCESIRDLIHKADTLLYQAKTLGRNQLVTAISNNPGVNLAPR